MNRKISKATAYRIRMKQELIAYKGGKCIKCDYSKNIPGAYDFHHRNPSEKKFHISRYLVLNREKLKIEADKCDLVCRNCHAELHDNSELRKEVMQNYQEWLDNKLEEKNCFLCQKKFQPHRRLQKCCKNCAPIANKKVLNPPSKDLLAEKMKAMTWVEIGKEYNVSDNAVKKWAKRMGLKWKKHSRSNKI